MNDRFLSSRAIDNRKRKVCIDAKAFSSVQEREILEAWKELAIRDVF